MNIHKLLSSKKYNLLDQFQRRKLLEKYILQNKDCKRGIKVLCFELETIINDKHKFFYKKYGRKRKVLTIGKEYTIIDYKEGKIKIENDEGKKLWYTTDRFLYSLKIERREKLKKLNKCQTD